MDPVLSEVNKGWTNNDVSISTTVIIAEIKKEADKYTFMPEQETSGNLTD